MSITAPASRPYRVAVIGCGFAGAASALFLSRAGHQVTVYERAAEPSPVGAGILLQPSGMAILQRLGLLDATVARGTPISALDCRSASGRRLFRLQYATVAPGLFGLGLHRGALFEVLFDALRRESVSMRAGTEVKAVQHLGSSAGVYLGTTLEPDRYDFVVLADGAHSQLRDGLGGFRHARKYRYGAVWFIGQDPDATFQDCLWQTCQGTRKMLGFLPSGFGPGQAQVPLVSLFWSLRMDQLDALRKRGLAAFKAEVRSLDARAEVLLQQIHHLDQLLPASYVDAALRRFHDGRVVCIGDTAHATSPQLGQGTNLALADAATLSDALTRHANLELALRHFSKQRVPAARYYRLSSKWLTPLFQSDLTPLGVLRDWMFPLVAQIPFVERQMLLTLAGLKRGFLGFSAKVPALQLTSSESRTPQLPALAMPTSDAKPASDESVA